MCGIVGIYRTAGLAPNFATNTIHHLCDSLRHRGPDNAGDWIDVDAGIALGHRRLSILDLSPAGHQPMLSASKRYVIVLNGEIYNHTIIRRELDHLRAGVAWRGRSDTETLLAAVDEWGISAAIQKCAGMFAFAIWDRNDRILTLGRDRIGEKPLYYGWLGSDFVFASELKALRQYPGFRADVNPNVLAEYMRYGYIKAPYSVYQNVFKLLPGTTLKISPKETAVTPLIPKVFWSLKHAVSAGQSNRFCGGDSDAIDQLDALLNKSVEMQRVADVPLGAFLSGGIDSSTIVAIMQAQASRPVKTFTIGFSDADYNEATHAGAIAEYLATDHTELYVSSRDAMNVVEKLPQLYDEPFGDSSAIPTYLVSELARRQVTVSLSGDGGDELFGGYSRYQQSANLWSKMRLVPRPLRSILSGGLRAIGDSANNSIFGQRSRRLSRYLAATTAEECYQVRITQRDDESELVLGTSPGRSTDYESAGSLIAKGHSIESMMYFDTMTYLPDDILAKVDRAAMGVSLESRVPMLNHDVVEFAWSLPMSMKIRDGDSKWVLKQVLSRYIPKHLTERPKMGFGVPVSDWIKGPMREWSESLISQKRLEQEGILNPELVRQLWSQHINGVPGVGDSVWQILMFQSWLESASTVSATK